MLALAGAPEPLQEKRPFVQLASRVAVYVPGGNSIVLVFIWGISTAMLVSPLLELEEEGSVGQPHGFVAGSQVVVPLAELEEEDSVGHPHGLVAGSQLGMEEDTGVEEEIDIAEELGKEQFS
jgi:hypothetical protein